MVKNLKRYRKSVDRESGKLEAAKYDFFPTTFELPVSLVFSPLLFSSFLFILIMICGQERVIVKHLA